MALKTLCSVGSRLLFCSLKVFLRTPSFLGFSVATGQTVWIMLYVIFRDSIWNMVTVTDCNYIYFILTLHWGGVKTDLEKHLLCVIDSFLFEKNFLRRTSVRVSLANFFVWETEGMHVCGESLWGVFRVWEQTELLQAGQVVSCWFSTEPAVVSWWWESSLSLGLQRGSFKGQWVGPLGSSVSMFWGTLRNAQCLVSWALCLLLMSTLHYVQSWNSLTVAKDTLPETVDRICGGR